MREEIKVLREVFIIKYCKKRGWSHNELTPNQMMEIINDNEYPK